MYLCRASPRRAHVESGNENEIVTGEPRGLQGDLRYHRVAVLNSVSRLKLSLDARPTRFAHLQRAFEPHCLRLYELLNAILVIPSIVNESYRVGKPSALLRGNSKE